MLDVLQSKSYNVARELQNMPFVQSFHLRAGFSGCKPIQNAHMHTNAPPLMQISNQLDFHSQEVSN